MGAVPSCISRDSEKNNDAPMNALRFTGNETVFKRKKRKRKKRYCHSCHRELGSYDDSSQLKNTSILVKSCVLKDKYYRNQTNERVIYKI